MEHLQLKKDLPPIRFHALVLSQQQLLAEIRQIEATNSFCKSAAMCSPKEQLGFEKHNGLKLYLHKQF